MPPAYRYDNIFVALMNTRQEGPVCDEQCHEVAEKLQGQI